MMRIDEYRRPGVDPDLPAGDAVYSVARLNREVRELLEGSISPLWVEGEIFKNEIRRSFFGVPGEFFLGGKSILPI